MVNGVWIHHEVKVLSVLSLACCSINMCVFGRVRVHIADFGELFPCVSFARTAACNVRADQMPQLRRDFITAGGRVRTGGQKHMGASTNGPYSKRPLGLNMIRQSLISE